MRTAARAAALWSEHRQGRTAAALAFYTLFSLAPILVIATAIAGVVWGVDAVQGRLLAQLSAIVGTEGGRLLEQMVANAYLSTKSGFAAAASVAAVLMGASAVFAELRDCFEQLWPQRARRPRRPLGGVVLALVAARLRGLAVVVGIGFVLLASLVLSSVLVALGEPIREVLAAAGALGWFMAALPLALSLAVTTAMLAVLLRLLLPVRMPRRRVLGTALAGAIFFELAKAAVSFYLGHSAVTSTFGAAGSMAVLLIWLYAVACVVLACAVLLRALDDPSGAPPGRPADAPGGPSAA
jgi:membrane protein